MTLENTYSLTKLGMSCPRSLLTVHTVRLHWARHAIISLGQHTRSDDVRHGKSSLPLDNTHVWTTSCVAGHHHPWTSTVDGQCEAMQAIIVLGLHILTDDIEHGMPSLPLESAQGKITLGMAYHHGPWT